MTILAFTDGASRGNPGESGIGIILKDELGNTISTQYGHIGRATNNIAEYMALVTCLKLAKKINCINLIVHSDSELMVRQLNGDYKIRNEGIKKLYKRIHTLLNSSSFQFKIKYIPRCENRDADRLANRGIETKKRLRI
jgi:ribonuclease HI